MVQLPSRVHQVLVAAEVSQLPLVLSLCHGTAVVLGPHSMAAYAEMCPVPRAGLTANPSVPVRWLHLLQAQAAA